MASGHAAADAVRVEGFGTNPGNLAMHVYLPDDRPTAPALVVALHGCTQSADDYLAQSGWRELADRDGFVLLLPEQKIANNTPPTGDPHFGETEVPHARANGRAQQRNRRLQPRTRDESSGLKPL